MELGPITGRGWDASPGKALLTEPVNTGQERGRLCTLSRQLHFTTKEFSTKQENQKQIIMKEVGLQKGQAGVMSRGRRGKI